MIYNSAEIYELSKISSDKDSNKLSNHLYKNDKKNKKLWFELKKQLQKRINETSLFENMVPDVFFPNLVNYYYKSVMGWHNNCDIVDQHRWYFVWNSHDKASFFRYRHPETGKIITKYEPKGWSVNHFQLGDCDHPLWHLIYTDEYRISIGLGTRSREQKI
tara:strand:- start:202 stop:684 length:483 start_codon:yes stop_codon:yes gene_type:complete